MSEESDQELHKKLEEQIFKNAIRGILDFALLHRIEICQEPLLDNHTTEMRLEVSSRLFKAIVLEKTKLS